MSATEVTDTFPTSTAPVVGSEPPSKALDQLTTPEGGDILDKARDIVKPYLDKVDQTTRPYVERVSATARPYTDAAAAKVNELVGNLQGTSAPVGEKGVLGEPTTTNLTPATGSTTTPASTASSVSGMFGQVAATVQNTFNQITHTIDEKTAAPTHPGIITQITNAIEKGTERVDAFLDKSLDAQPAASTPVGAQPVQTTTNTVPHVVGGTIAPQ